MSAPGDFDCCISGECDEVLNLSGRWQRAVWRVEDATGVRYLGSFVEHPGVVIEETSAIAANAALDAAEQHIRAVIARAPLAGDTE